MLVKKPGVWTDYPRKPRTAVVEVREVPRYLCDDCKYDYGDACRRPERPNAISCSDYVPRYLPVWVPPPRGPSARELLDSLPVVTTGTHPEIRQAIRGRRLRRLAAALSALAAGALIALQLLH